MSTQQIKDPQKNKSKLKFSKLNITNIKYVNNKIKTTSTYLLNKMD